MAGEDWSLDEVEAIVADYFAMLRAELAGEPYSKTAHRRGLAPQLDGRSGPSIEFKHANISAVTLRFKGLTYESLGDPDFRKAAEKVGRDVQRLHDEFDAAKVQDSTEGQPRSHE